VEARVLFLEGGDSAFGNVFACVLVPGDGDFDFGFSVAFTCCEAPVFLPGD